jgi:uncharacterized protein YodC (DUF2158 family)
LKDEEVEELEVKLKSLKATKSLIKPSSYYWWNDLGNSTIIAYRVLKWKKKPDPQDPYAELKKAHAEGKVIQYNCASAGYEPEWEDLPIPVFSDGPEGYRIKPEPETFTAHGKTWTCHTPGDPMPCDGGRMVEACISDRLQERPADKGWNWNWESHTPVVGWRYADEPTPEPEVKPWTPVAGDVVQLKSGGPVMTVGCSTEHTTPSVSCAWFDGATLCSTPIPTACLQPA